ncbi:ammonium transporter [Lactobacillus sp. S2-2]|uniref:ammonium transporter n=1 Tax=Lactobacillus sp. S2-2 TaxID=2692917 RepID=UPI001F9B346B|nr:ammonium transporter [Lactobacillus sp. S2-2]MCF6515191.1 ammonium transporter [Lactobacillus sp. S2-2]
MILNNLFIFFSALLVFIMTPGLAFFYGGMSSKKNVVNTMLSIFMICGIQIILWISIGYSLSFSGNNFDFIGNLHNFMLNHIYLFKKSSSGNIFNINFINFQMMFSIITPALFIGSVIGRMNFKFLIFFTILWSILIYYPLVHLVWGGGFLSKLGILDFAGGTVIHINAGVTGLVLALLLGKRKNIKEKPYNLAWVLLGTTLIWFGWYGFNSGSSLSFNTTALQAMITTSTAAATGMITWIILDTIFNDSPSLLGTCTGTICGLVAITPACAFVSIKSSFIIGIFASIFSFIFVNLIKPKLNIDDTLDVFGCHGISGIVGSLLTGIFASKSINKSIMYSGLIENGNIKLLLVQILGVSFSIIYTGIMVFIIIKILNKFLKFRINYIDEKDGLDIAYHYEKVEN